MSHEALSHDGLTVLLVEDDANLRALTAEDLRARGFRVLEAANTLEGGTVLCGAAQVDVLVSDIAMPGTMDGEGLAMWALDAHPDVGIILTSGYAAARRLGELKLRGGRFLTKPYRMDDLAAQIVALSRKDRAR